MSCQAHAQHNHQHSPACGHVKIKHNNHVDYLHGSHLHHLHEGHWDECRIEVSAANPQRCEPLAVACKHDADCGHQLVPHGDHFDYLVAGRLQHVHAEHVDDHGLLELV